MNEESAYGFVYLTTNHVNGKKYVGKRIFDDAGKWRKYLGSGVNLKKAIRKYGVDSFSKQIIDVAYSKEELNSLEQYWIAYYDAIHSPKFYNVSPGGDGGRVVAGYSDDEMEIYVRNREEGRSRWLEVAPIGEDAPGAKLLNSDVDQIIKRILNGDYSSDIAHDYHVGISTIDDIRYHRTWKHMTKDIVFPDTPKKRTGKNKKPVDVFDMQMRYICTYESSRAVEKELGVSFKLVSAVCKGEKHTSHGYIFRFAQ